MKTFMKRLAQTGFTVGTFLFFAGMTKLNTVSFLSSPTDFFGAAAVSLAVALGAGLILIFLD